MKLASRVYMDILTYMGKEVHRGNLYDPPTPGKRNMKNTSADDLKTRENAKCLKQMPNQ